jgi:hypothetical protein
VSADDTTYVVLGLEGSVASGRTKETGFFTKNFHFVEIFCEKEKVYHAAAGEAGRYRLKHLV